VYHPTKAMTSWLLCCAVQTLHELADSEAFQQGRREGLQAVEGGKQAAIEVGRCSQTSQPTMSGFTGLRKSCAVIVASCS